MNKKINIERLIGSNEFVPEKVNLIQSGVKRFISDSWSKSPEGFFRSSRFVNLKEVPARLELWDKNGTHFILEKEKIIEKDLGGGSTIDYVVFNQIN